jgi:hypothetical protein
MEMADMKDAQDVALRDYFAAKALAGCLANQHTYAWAVDDPDPDEGRAAAAKVARCAYALADAMLVARKGTP